MEDKSKGCFDGCAIVVAQDDLPAAVDVLNAGISLGLFEVSEIEFTFLGEEADEP